jgi:hypothetical protein
MPRPRFNSLIISTLLMAILFACSPWLASASAVDLEGAIVDLGLLKKATKKRATNEDLLTYLDAVFNAYKAIDGPTKPADDAPEEEKKAYDVALAKHVKAVAKYRSAAEKQILKILTLVKIKNETNVRSDANIRAANILGDMGKLGNEKAQKSLSKKIMQAIEKHLTKVKGYDINSEHLVAAFAALGKINHKSSLAWMINNHSHANEVKKQYLIAAHKAMVLYTDVLGPMRYEVCETFRKVYGSVESQAERNSTDPKDLAKKRFWDDIKTHTVPVIQYYAGKPTNEDGGALATMADFEVFMRAKKNPRKAPWLDAKPVKKK